MPRRVIESSDLFMVTIAHSRLRSQSRSPFCNLLTTDLLILMQFPKEGWLVNSPEALLCPARRQPGLGFLQEPVKETVWFCAGKSGQALQIRNDGFIGSVVLRNRVARVQVERGGKAGLPGG